MSKTQGKPIQIAYISESKLKFNGEALRTIFDKVGNRPVSIISLNGSPKADKSHIMSYFVKFLVNYGDRDWFMDKNGLDSQWDTSEVLQTPGISIWSEPIIVRKSGDHVAVLLMNAQGCFDGMTSTPGDLLIFALSFVLSSNMVYCVPDKLSEELLQFLQLFVGYSTGSLDLETTENFFELIFMIREGQIPGSYEFGYHDSSTNPGAKNLLQDILHINNEEVGEYEFNHEITLSSFRKIACCLFPGEDIDTLDINHNLPTKFVDAMKEIVPRILHPSNVYLKRIGNQKFRGQDLLRLFDEIAILLNNNEISHYKDVNEYTAEVQCLVSLLNGLNFYRWIMDRMMSENRLLTEEQLKELHDENMKNTLSLYTNKKAVQYNIIWSRYHNRLQEMVQNSYNLFLQVNGVRNDFSKVKNQTEEVKDEMEKRIRELKQSFPNSLRELNNHFINVVGIDLEGLTLAVNHVFNQNSRNGQ